MSLKPILEVTAAIAADLRQEFYRRVSAATDHARAAARRCDVEMLEDVFSTLCYLFKYTLRQLLADLPGAFAAYVHSPIRVST